MESKEKSTAAFLASLLSQFKSLTVYETAVRFATVLRDQILENQIEFIRDKLDNFTGAERQELESQMRAFQEEVDRRNDST